MVGKILTWWEKFLLRDGTWSEKFPHRRKNSDMVGKKRQGGVHEGIINQVILFKFPYIRTYPNSILNPISYIYIVRSARKLRARRTVCKSVFFFKRHKLLAKDRGLSGLKGRGFGDSATCRPSEYH